MGSEKYNSNTTLVKVKYFTNYFFIFRTTNSNTTLVKVKFLEKHNIKNLQENSNTTLVKVKCVIIFGFS